MPKSFMVVAVNIYNWNYLLGMHSRAPSSECVREGSRKSGPYGHPWELCEGKEGGSKRGRGGRVREGKEKGWMEGKGGRRRESKKKGIAE